MSPSARARIVSVPACVAGSSNPNLIPPMSIIAAGAEAPDFELDSHLDSKVKLSDYRGKKSVMLVFYPLDFTPT